MGDKRELRVVIVGDASSAEKALGVTAHGVSGLTTKSHTLSTALGVTLANAFTAAASKAASFVKQSLGKFEEVGGQVRQLERATGASAKSMSQLRYAANVLGVDSTKLGTGIGLLAKHLEKNDATAKALGITYRDAKGNLLPFNDILGKVADRISSMPNGIEKTSLVLNTFGRGGLALLPILNQGSAGLKKMAAESNALGDTLSGKDVRATRQAAIEHAKLNAAIEAVQLQLGRFLLPVVEKVVTGLAHFVAMTRTAVNWVGKNKDVVKTLALVLAPVAGFILAVATATKIWAAGQAVLNLVLDANPIVLIVAAIAALAVGLVEAWRKSEKFRDVVTNVWHVLERVAGEWVQINVAAFKFVFDSMTSFVGGMLHLAASAFGWVPGIGGKLKDAAHAFDSFRSDVDGTLSRIANDASQWGRTAGDQWLRGWQFGVNGQGTGANSPFRDPGHPGYTGATTVAKAAKTSGQKLAEAVGTGVAAGVKAGTPKATKTAVDATAKLVDAVKNKVSAFLSTVRGFRSTISQGILSNFDLGSLWQSLTDNGSNTVNSLQGSLSRILGKVRHFARDLKQLAKEGASKFLIEQIAGMGPDQGLGLAEALLSASHGAFESINKTLSSINKAAGQGALGLSDTFYSEGADSIEKLIAGMEQKHPKLRKALNQIAKEVHHAFGETGSHHGGNGNGGGHHHEHWSGNAPHTVNNYVTVKVAGSVTAERELAESIRKELLKLGHRNVRVGLA